MGPPRSVQALALQHAPLLAQNSRHEKIDGERSALSGQCFRCTLTFRRSRAERQCERLGTRPRIRHAKIEWPYNELVKPLSRPAYLGIGVLLSGVKVALDYAVARAFDHPFSLLFYVSPVDAPLFHPGPNLAYYGAMWAVAVPFIAIGVWLTARRLIDAAMSPWLTLLFFFPFANLLFFALCALAPPRPLAKSEMPAQPVYRESGQPVKLEAPERKPGAVVYMAGGLGAVIALGAVGISVGILKQYGAALMIGAPTIAGFASGAFTVRLDPRSPYKRAALATLLASLITCIGLIAFAYEGVVCLVMAMPILLPPAFLGAFIGYRMARSAGPAKVPPIIAASVLLFPLLLGVEHVSPLPPLEPSPVETQIVIDAPRERVFPLVARVSDMPAPTEMLFRVGISYPIRATLDEDRVGSVRRCEFNTGTALETVTRYDAPNHFAFHIDSQPDPLREATLYRGPRQPHLDGYVRNLEGIFDLEALPGGKTRVTAKSVYRVSMTPETYWRIWTDAVIHTIHRRVLENVKARAEGKAPVELAER